MERSICDCYRQAQFIKWTRPVKQQGLERKWFCVSKKHSVADLRQPQPTKRLGWRASSEFRCRGLSSTYRSTHVRITLPAACTYDGVHCDARTSHEALHMRLGQQTVQVGKLSPIVQCMTCYSDGANSPCQVRLSEWKLTEIYNYWSSRPTFREANRLCAWQRETLGTGNKLTPFNSVTPSTLRDVRLPLRNIGFLGTWGWHRLVVPKRR